MDAPEPRARRTSKLELAWVLASIALGALALWGLLSDTALLSGRGFAGLFLASLASLSAILLIPPRTYAIRGRGLAFAWMALLALVLLLGGIVGLIPGVEGSRTLVTTEPPPSLDVPPGASHGGP